jgi:hypothetical protein
MTGMMGGHVVCVLPQGTSIPLALAPSCWLLILLLLLQKYSRSILVREGVEANYACGKQITASYLVKRNLVKQVH